MKKIGWLWFIMLFVTINATAQTEADRYVQSILKQEAYILNGTLLAKEYKPAYIKYDFSTTWLNNIGNEFVVGFIGSDYERVRIKFLTVIKNPKKPDTYTVYGKSKVKNNICKFRGTFQIIHIRLYENTYPIADSIKKMGIVIAKYKLYEDSAQKHAGIFEGIVASNWYIPNNKNKVYLDDLESDGAPGYSNNSFIGEWKSYDKKYRKKCNWGDFQIPNIDENEFSVSYGISVPDKKFAANGWKSYIDGHMLSEDEDVRKKAQEEEAAEWWK